MNISLDETLLDGVNERLEAIDARLAYMENVLVRLVNSALLERTSNENQERAMSELSLRIDNAVNEVAPLRSAVDSARALMAAMRTDVQAIRDQLSERGFTDEDLAALDALTTSIEDNTDDLAEAVAENTDAESDSDTTGGTTPGTTETPTGTPEPAPTGGPTPMPTEGVDSAPMGTPDSPNV